MKVIRKVGQSVALIAGASMLMIGCGQTPSTTTSKGVGTTSSAKPLVMVPAPNGNFQRNFNPFQQAANHGTLLVYEPLFYMSDVGPDVYPILGKDKSWSSDNKSLTVNLQPNAKWTDGQAFTAEDVVFTFNLLKQYPAADTSGIWKELSSVTANGDHQVVFTFNAVDVPFSYYVLQQPIVPEHIWKSLGDPTKANITQPIGTGPYILSSFTPQLYKFKANDSYYGGTPTVPEVDFPAYSGNDSADLALAKGEIDWAGIFIPDIEHVYAAKDPHNKYWFPPENMVVMYTNLKDPLLSQLPVRKAISLALDRDALSQKAEYGYEPVASPTGLTLPANQSWLASSLPAADTKFTFDQAAAVKTLQDAGFKKNSNGIFESPDGKPLTFTLQVVSGWSDWDTICSMAAEQLKQVGIDVKVQQEQFGAYMDNIQGHKYQLAISWTNAGPGPYYQYKNLLSSTGNWNLEQWNDSATDQAIEAFSQTTDDSTQKQAIYKLERIMAEQLPSIPLLYGAVWYEYNDSKYTGWPDENNPYAKPAPFAWPAPEVVLMHLKPAK